MSRISVILPVYNVKAYLTRCLDSVLKSCGDEYRDSVEILLIDDGSTDGSEILCDQLSQQYPNLVCTVHKENGGLASARNEGIHHAKGEYVLFVDSDDWIEQDTIPKLLMKIEKEHPDIVKFGYNRIENGVCIEKTHPGLENRTYYDVEIQSDVYYEVLGNGRLFNYSSCFVISAWASLYKMDLIQKSGILFESERVYLNEDILFNLKITAFASSIAVLPDCFYNYDCRQGSLTQTRKIEMYERKCAFLDNYLTFAEEKGITDGALFRGRYSQLVIQHLYECAVSECNWNLDRHDRYQKLRVIFKDERLKTALNNLDGIHMSKKARAIKLVLQTENPALFHYLYKLGRLRKGR